MKTDRIHLKLSPNIQRDNCRQKRSSHDRTLPALFSALSRSSGQPLNSALTCQVPYPKTERGNVWCVIRRDHSQVAAVDLFCGAGGLSFGLVSAGVDVVAGFDVDKACRYPFEANISGSVFLERDVRTLGAEDLNSLWPRGALRVLAGCAPCQPFSPYRRGAKSSSDERWPLLQEFTRLVCETKPEFVTTENVPPLAGTSVFREFVHVLEDLGYSIDSRNRSCLDYGLPQSRRRLVLVASLLGEVTIPDGPLRGLPPCTVGNTIRVLPPIAAGDVDADDPLHRSRKLEPINLERIQASTPGGTWLDWPEELRSPCHRRSSGASFKNVYARMEWDKPSPTLTTHFHNFGTGRFGHPEQDRAISVREAAMLQGFPRDYRFVEPGQKVQFTTLGRLIGNAVPPPLGQAIGEALLNQAKANGLE